MKSLFMNQSLARKQIILLLFVGLLPMLVASIVSDNVAEKELVKQSYGQLESVREIKAVVIKNYFANIQKQILDVASKRETVSAMDAFRRSFETMADRDGYSSEGDIQFLKTELASFYNSDFLTEYINRNDGRSIDVDSLLDGLSPRAIVAQYQYIKANPSPLGKKHLLNAADGKANYHRMHNRYHNGFLSFLERFGFYDIFLVEPQNGVIVYSVFKELDFATSLNNGPYAKTNFADAFREALTLKQGEFILKDFASYRPSYDAPASFIASPIYDDGTLRGVLVFQMPLETINEIMGQRDGMGETGESYLVGSDFLMRSDSVLEPETHSVAVSFRHPEKGSAKTEAVERAFSGEVATDVSIDYRGEETLAAFKTIDLGSGIQWAIVAEISVEEAFSGISKLYNTLIIIALVGSIIIVLFAWWVSRLFTAPIKQMVDTIKHVQEEGDFTLSIDNEYKDEVGDACRAYNHLMNDLSMSISSTNQVLDNLRKGDFNHTIEDSFPGQLGVLADGVNNAVADIKAANEEQLKQAAIADDNALQAEQAAKKAKAQAEEVLVIKKALDNSATSTMIADDDYNLIYTNKSLVSMMSEAESDIKKALPDFDAENLVGKNIDIFHVNPAHQRAMLDALRGTHVANIKVGARDMNFVATPIMENGKRLGLVVEWIDRTAELAIEKEIDNIISSAATGDFENKLTLEGKEGFLLNVSEGLNALLDTTNIAINDVKRVFSALAEGDLSQQIDRDYEGGFAQLKADANTTVGKLKEVIGDIGHASDSITRGSQEISLGNQDLSTRTESQASTLEQTSASMEEITQIVRSSEGSAKQASDLASRTAGNAREGSGSVQKTIDAMEQISQASNKIANIIGVIDEIAFQTNLLALNAAVEAARAGEQGRGFAVVAGEVRTLAQRSAGAAKEIKGLINDSVAKVKDGSVLVANSGETLNTIVEEVEQVSNMLEAIATSAREQTSGIEQVNEAVLHMDQMTQQNAALVEEAAAASQSMSEQAQDMNRLITFFRQ